MTTESASPSSRDAAKTTTTTKMTTTTTRQQPSLPPSPWPLWRFVPVPRFRFMVHDRWSNVLFLHWRVPEHLEPILERHAAPFRLDRFDGSAWIGLILLTEEAVGPSLGRNRYTCVTHHGVNVRTYVRGSGSGSGDATATTTAATTTATTTATTAPRGIHFSSLECDDEFTSYGANFFGMPYRVAAMERTYGRSEPSSSDSARSTSEPTPARAQAERYWYRLRSERLPRSAPSLLRVLSHALRWCRPRKLHTTTTTTTTTIVGTSWNNNNNNNNDNSNHNHENNHENKTAASSPRSEPSSTPDSGESSSNNNSNSNDDALPQSPKKAQTFTFDCTWSRSVSGDASDATTPTTPAIPAVDPFADWACERYFVYTEAYGTQWRGEVEHEPWPTCEVRLERLSITGAETYEPGEMRPLLSHMAGTPPDRVGFSPGVGPVRFQMLQPVGAG